MSNSKVTTADPTAVRVALWRALHLEVDAPPFVIEDRVGLQLAAPGPGWRERPDMHPQGTRGFRAGIVARARFVEDFLRLQFDQGVRQYVVLGAGLDSLAQRAPAALSGLHVFEVDHPATQAWKRQRLQELGLKSSVDLHFVPVDFEAGESWWDQLRTAGFDPSRPAVVASTGVSLYLTREANAATLAQVAKLAPGSSLAMTYYLPLELIDPADRPLQEMVQERARAAGTPFVSFFGPSEIEAMALQAGFCKAETVSRADLIRRYFAGRSDGLAPASGEEFLVAVT